MTFTNRQRYAIENPSTRAMGVIDRGFTERIGKYFTVFTINK